MLSYSILSKKGASFTGYIVCASNLDSPKQASAKETQSTLVPIPKKHA